MDELLQDFVCEGGAQSRVAGAALLALGEEAFGLVFQLARGLQASCGFFDLPRLERITAATATYADRRRDGAAAEVGGAAIATAAVDRIRNILADLEQGRGEPFCDDSELIQRLESDPPPSAIVTCLRRAEHARAPRRRADGVFSEAISRTAGPIENSDAILVAAPNLALRDLVVRTLTRVGFAVTGISDAREFAAVLGVGFGFRAIFVDFDLAARSRGEIARSLRAGLNSKPMLIGLATHGGPAMQASARALGLHRAVGAFDRVGIATLAHAALAPFAVEIAA